mmetsp:Transcript_10444/g.36695  ORF Transcript_10444/g.36695 Transcript_10444/m.36695 type:complete len:244 (+) Transcript_10444:1659-2390(+)
MPDAAAVASQHEVHTCKDILGQVEGLRCLRNTALLHHVLLVHDVRVPVVHSSAEHRVAALQHGAEGQLRAGGEVAHGAEVARDVLRQPDDAFGLVATSCFCPELPEHARQEQHLLEVRALVRVDALAECATHERDRVVLVVALSVTQDRKPWQLDLELRSSTETRCRIGSICSRRTTASDADTAGRDQRATFVDEATEVAAALPLVNAIRLSGDVLVRPIDVRHLQAVREFRKHPVCLLQLGL